MPVQKLKKYLENVILRTYFTKENDFEQENCYKEINIHISFLYIKRNLKVSKFLIMLIMVTKCVQNNIYVKVSMYSTIL